MANAAVAAELASTFGQGARVVPLGRESDAEFVGRYMDTGEGDGKTFLRVAVDDFHDFYIYFSDSPRQENGGWYGECGLGTVFVQPQEVN